MLVLTSLVVLAFSTVGYTGPVNGDPAIDAGYFHGKDGLGDATDIAQIDLDDGNHGLDSSANAVDAILALAVEAEAAQADLTLVSVFVCSWLV